MEEESIFNKKKPLHAQNIVKYPNTVDTFFSCGLAAVISKAVCQYHTAVSLLTFPCAGTHVLVQG